MSTSTPDDLGLQQADPVLDSYSIVQCTFRSNRTFAGYLASSTNAYVWLTQDPNQAARVKWLIDRSGRWWLEKATSPNDRFLGVAGNDYADWGLWQADPNGYIEPVIYNSDHTISLAKDTSKSLYGPYGDQWVRWGQSQNVLVCELVPVP
jgi:hypothetical protein